MNDMGQHLILFSFCECLRSCFCAYISKTRSLGSENISRKNNTRSTISNREEAKNSGGKKAGLVPSAGKHR